MVKVEAKDVGLPDTMKRAMARQAEAERERRAKVIAAEGEYQAAERLSQAAGVINQEHGALTLRTLQTLAEVATEHNSTLVSRSRWTCSTPSWSTFEATAAGSS